MTPSASNDNQEQFEEIEIAGHTFKLTGRDAHRLSYHHNFDPHPKDGTPFFKNISAIKDEVGKALKAAGISEKIEEKIHDLQEKSPALLGNIPFRIENSRVQITEIGIDSLNGIYSFAFDVDLPSAKVGNISIVAFGLRISYRRKP